MIPYESVAARYEADFSGSYLETCIGRNKADSSSFGFTTVETDGQTIRALMHAAYVGVNNRASRAAFAAIAVRNINFRYVAPLSHQVEQTVKRSQEGQS